MKSTANFARACQSIELAKQKRIEKRWWIKRAQNLCAGHRKYFRNRGPLKCVHLGVAPG